MASAMVVVTNTASGLHSIQFDRDKKAVQLAPGANIVPRADWEECEKIAVIQQAIADGRLKVGGAVPGDGLKGMNEPKAIALVGETLHMATLRAWADAEQRPAVIFAIKRRLEEIEREAAVSPQPAKAAAK